MLMRMLSITLLLFLCTLCSADNWRHVSRRFQPPCCVKFSTADIRNDVTGTTYREPYSKPPCVKAILLMTRYGQVCVNPRTEWVRNITASMTKA